MSWSCTSLLSFFFFQAEDGIRVYKVTGVQTCALPILTLAALRVRGSLLRAGRGWLEPDLHAMRQTRRNGLDHGGPRQAWVQRRSEERRVGRGRRARGGEESEKQQ